MAKIVSFDNYKRKNIVEEEGSSKGRVQIVYQRNVFDVIRGIFRFCAELWYSIL
jgi:hypothetical protein